MCPCLSFGSALPSVSASMSYVRRERGGGGQENFCVTYVFKLQNYVTLDEFMDLKKFRGSLKSDDFLDL